jgi:acyl-CoA synthetase (AMP-forming)/AMP-acid ligase II/acyl carrier protein
MKSTIQEIFNENIISDNETGITFIEGRNSLEHLSYKKLYLEACYKLYSLQEKGLKPGDELVFQFESNKNFIITFWACIFGKIVPVPIAYAAASNTLKKICGVWKTLKNPYVITDNVALIDYFQKFKNEEDVFDKMLEKLISYDDLPISKRGIPLQSDLSDLVFIQFSSGSTGFPKGVTNSQEAILYNINNYLKHLSINSSDKLLGWVPLTHDMGLVFFHILPLLSNSPQFLMPPSLFLTFPELWLESLSQHEITISGSPNFGYKLILENLNRIQSEKLSLGNLRIMLNSAEPVSIDVCRKFTNEFAPQGLSKKCISPGYGLAEAVLGVSLCHQREFEEYLLDRRKLNIGDEIKVLNQESDIAASFANVGTFDGTKIKITNEDGKILPDGNLGFIHLKSKAVTKEFYNNSLITQNTISVDGWLNTGDIGFIHNKQLVITGREKEMILINGQNYFPNDIDSLLEELPGINFQQAISCNVFNEKENTDEIFVFVHFKGAVSDFITLMMQIKRHISFKLGVPVSKVIAVDKIPKTTSGKPQRYLLRDNFVDGKYDDFLMELKTGIDSITAKLKKLSQQQIENKIIPIVEQITGVEDVNVSTNFFDIGFTSIKTIQLKASLEELFMEKIDDMVFFKHTNTKDLAKYIFTDVLKNDKGKTVINSSLESTSSAKARMGKLLRSSALS